MKSIPRALLLGEQALILRPRGMPTPPGFPLFLFARTRAMLALVVELPQGAPLMEWVTPQHEEIDLNCEISSYANAEL